MKVRPIIFSAPMVKALLSGTKTQTRRVISPQPARFGETVLLPQRTECPYGYIGDWLWVRETWSDPWDVLVYRADDDGAAAICSEHQVWHSPLHMPRWACRITLEITDVRVERLREISEKDAQAEGCPADRFYAAHDSNPTPQCSDWFRESWDELNARRGYPWTTNPWVWVLTFRVHHRNVDELLKEATP